MVTLYFSIRAWNLATDTSSTGTQVHHFVQYVLRIVTGCSYHSYLPCVHASIRRASSRATNCCRARSSGLCTAGVSKPEFLRCWTGRWRCVRLRIRTCRKSCKAPLSTSFNNLASQLRVITHFAYFLHAVLRRTTFLFQFRFAGLWSGHVPNLAFPIALCACLLW